MGVFCVFSLLGLLLNGFLGFLAIFWGAIYPLLLKTNIRRNLCNNDYLIINNFGKLFSSFK